ncbi:MAG: BMP family ABC transporter substrate-binding protein [Rhodobacter sp.]|nr:BMP family ABC transporter substrate-binding protein [Rhodobacter sp.]MCY4169033.1 BMP family ABC transporter substrate-binding protein [Rhodobacter sp.]MCY4240303.1 BMP family ABC transporter substrate-binding protein [Rhodobacter sp.]
MVRKHSRILLQAIGFMLVALGAPMAFAEDRSVVLVATQKAGDRGPIDGLIDGLEQAEAAFGVETRFIEALDPATFENTLHALARRGTDIIVTTFFAMGAAVQNLAAEYPETRFVVVVAAPLDPPLANARIVGYATQENAYLAGTFGATVSETGHLGLIAGVPLPYVWADVNAMTMAARAVKPEATVTHAFVQSFEDPVKGREVAAGLYDRGIDVIYTGAAASDIGVVEAADETDNLVIVASPPLVEQAPESVGFVASFEWARTMMIEIENALGDFESGFRVGGIATGEIIMTFSDAYAATNPRAPEARAATETVYDQIAAGQMTVPYDETEPK